MNSSPAAIALQDIHKKFGDKQVLQGIDLQVNQGESLVVIGGSGSGKSVMLRCVLGLLAPDQGMISINGQEVIGLKNGLAQKARRSMGMLFQNAALFDSLSVWENVAFILINLRKMKRREARSIAISKLARVGLDEQTADLRPVELSGGMKKRVALARAIADDPQILLFDEPTTGLDPITADVINDLIAATSRDIGASVLSITHDMASARKIADRIAMIYEGKIIWSGAVADIDQSGNDYVEQFIHGRAEGPIQTRIDA